VPLIVGRALRLAPEQIALLISADLFCCGLVTLIQSLGVTRWFGIRMPVMMGVTFASVGPMLAMAADPTLGITGIFRRRDRRGRDCDPARAIHRQAAAPVPPVVTGTIIAVIGISLMRVAIQWAVGGAALQPLMLDPAAPAAGPARMIAKPRLCRARQPRIALLVLVAIVLIAKFARGLLPISRYCSHRHRVHGGARARQDEFRQVAQAQWFSL